MKKLCLPDTVFQDRGSSGSVTLPGCQSHAAFRGDEQLNITLEVRPSAKELISEAGFDEKYGARPLKRAIQTKVEDALAQEILEGRVKAGDTVAVGVSKKEVKFVVKNHKELEKNDDL